MKSIDDLLRETNYYKILNVAENATDAEIKLAYRGLIFEFHPDRVKQEHPEIDAETANRISQIINSAYDTLKNPQTRKEFDEELAALRRQREQARAAEEYRRQREQARAAEEYRRQREEARAKQAEASKQNSYNRSQNAWQGTYGYETRYERTSYTGEKERAHANFHEQNRQTNKQRTAYGASRKYKRAKKNPYVKAVFTKFKSKLADIFSEENINDCKLIARGIARKIRRIYQRETRGVILGTINGILIAAILFNVFSVNNKEKMEEPIIPDTTITTEIENDVTTPNITYEQPIIIEAETYELMEYVTANPGESLWDFMERYGVPIDKIKRDNNLISDDIYAGQDYKIIKEVDADELEKYSVNYAYSGETISDLARKFNTNEETIRNLNKDVIDENGNIEFGTTIVNVPDLDRSHSYHR